MHSSSGHHSIQDLDEPICIIYLLCLNYGLAVDGGWWENTIINCLNDDPLQKDEGSKKMRGARKNDECRYEGSET